MTCKERHNNTYFLVHNMAVFNAHYLKTRIYEIGPYCSYSPVNEQQIQYSVTGVYTNLLSI